MDDPLTPMATLPPCAPKLAVHSQPNQSKDFVPMRLLLEPGGFTVHVDKPDVLVGRHSGADVRLTLPDVSRRHCRFVFADGSWRVFDLNSTNGIYVNDEKLNEATIVHGDKVRVGGLTFKVELDKGSERIPLKKAS